MVKCNRGCGAENLRWKTVSGKYKLFNHNDLLHICNDGIEAPKRAQEKATAGILDELDLKEPALIPLAEAKEKVHVKENNYDRDRDPRKMFTITSTVNGVAVTGDDKHNAIYLPKVAIPELVKVLVDFIC